MKVSQQNYSKNNLFWYLHYSRCRRLFKDDKPSDLVEPLVRNTTRA